MEIIKRLVMSAHVILLDNVNTHKKDRNQSKARTTSNYTCEKFRSPNAGKATATPRAALSSLTSVQCAMCVGREEGMRSYIFVMF